eukprot:GILJ01012566.1.p1 GENE.GILJ01012566.1~~GILJ01012566.1.p1  ORF type:complete len:269 (+),score=16.42 GILJ01012566.1:172-978(+)
MNVLNFNRRQPSRSMLQNALRIRGRASNLLDENDDLSYYAQKVVSVSVLSAVLLVVSMIAQAIVGLYGYFAALFLLFVPSCGYVGAKHCSPQLIKAFASCSAIVFLVALSYGLVLASLTIPQLECICDPLCKISQQRTAPTFVDYYEYLCERPTFYRSFLIVSVICTFISSALQLLGAFWGFKLQKEIKKCMEQSQLIPHRSLLYPSVFTRSASTGEAPTHARTMSRGQVDVSSVLLQPDALKPIGDDIEVEEEMQRKRSSGRSAMQP